MIKKILQYVGLYYIFGVVWEYTHNAKKAKAIINIFVPEDSKLEMKCMAALGFVKDGSPKKGVRNQIGF